MKQLKKCPICSSEKTAQVKIIDKYPAIIFPVDNFSKIETKTLSIFCCQNCSHVFQCGIDSDFNERIYTEYYKYYPYSGVECFIECYRKPFERIFSTIENKTKGASLLEIGVSTSEQLDYFVNLGYKAVGITPQVVESNDIISSFYEEHSFKQKFDVIVSRFNLEHIVDLNHFMEKVKCGEIKVANAMLRIKKDE